MLHRLKQTLAHSHLWLFAGGLLIAASLVLGYHEAQVTADRTMALRQGPPPTAAIQSFDPERHRGMAGEVNVVAEIDPAGGMVTQYGPDGSGKSAVIYPLYSLSQAGLKRLTDQIAGAGHAQPVDTPAAAPPQATGPVLGVLVQPIEAGIPAFDIADLLSRISIGPGNHGTAIILNGELRSSRDLVPAIDAALAARGQSPLGEKALLILPFPQGRVAALSAPAPSDLRRILFWSGLGLVVIAAAISVRPRVPEEAAQFVTEPLPLQSLPTRRFAPISTQDDLTPAAGARQGGGGRDVAAMSRRAFRNRR